MRRLALVAAMVVAACSTSGKVSYSTSSAASGGAGVSSTGTSAASSSSGASGVATGTTTTGTSATGTSATGTSATGTSATGTTATGTTITSSSTASTTVGSTASTAAGTTSSGSTGTGVSGSTTSGSLTNTALTPFNLGGGGNVSGLDISATGVRFARGDVFGGYVYGSDDAWHLINGEANMCPSGYPCPYFGWDPGNTSDNQSYVGFSGVMDLVGCPSSASCAYMYGGGRVFYSANISTSNPSAISWCDTNFTPTADTSNEAVSASDPGPFMAVDPSNSAHVIAGTPANGVFETFNGTACGSASWTAISTANIPLSTASTPAYLVAFDPTATATCHTGSGTCAKNAYLSTNGGGVYATTNAGASWVLTSSGPTALRHLKVSAATAGGGNVWGVDTNGNVWEYRAGVWAERTGISGGDVAIDPLNGDHVVVGNGANLYVSTNGSAATPTFTAASGSFAAGDSPWALLDQIIYYTGTNWLAFDPTSAGTLIGTGGQWVFKTSFPSGAFAWSIMSSGIQGTVSLGNVQVGAQGTPTFGLEDVGACTFHVATAATTPSSCAVPNQFYYLIYTSGLSVAAGTTFMASKTSNDFDPGFDLSGYSTDGYQTSYLPFNNWNATVAATSITQNPSGGYRVALASTSRLSSFAPGQTLSANSTACFLWEQYFSWPGFLNETCWPITVVDGTHIDLVGSTYSAQAATPGYNYIVYAPAPPLSDWFGGGAVLGVTDNGSGLVRVQYPNGPDVAAHQTPICISGVVMAGATVVNGCWVVAATNGQYVDLLGSSFASGDSYLSGGTVLSTGDPGGSVAASTPTNIAIYGGDTSFPYCTTNAGATWSRVSVAGVPGGNGVTVSGGPYPAGTTTITVSNGANLAYQTILQLASGRALDESGPHVSGNTVTLPNPIPTGDSLANGSPIYTSTGGPFAAYFRSHQLAADQVTPNTFYYVNDLVGLVKWTNCDATTIVSPASQGFLADADNDQLKAVPHEAGHLFFTTGSVGVPNHPAGNQFWRTCNGTSSAAGSVAMQVVPGFWEVQAFGFGQAAPGQDYPAIYAVGWYSADNQIKDAVYGVWRSVDDANNGATGTCSGGNTWTNLASATGGFPAGFPAFVEDIEGDPFVYGPYYILGSFGQFYGVQN